MESCPPATDSRLLCQAAVECGRVTPNAVISRNSDGHVEVIPLDNEIHSTPTFNGIAVVYPLESVPQLPPTVRADECPALLSRLSESIPPTAGIREVTLIPFAL